MAVTAEALQLAKSKLRRSPVRPELIEAKRRLKSKSEVYNIAKGKICSPGKKLSKNNKCVKTLRKKRSSIKRKSKKRSIKRKSKKRSVKRKSIKRRSKKPSVKRRSKKPSVKRRSKKRSIKRKI